MADRPRRASDQDVRSGRTLKLNGEEEPEPEEPITRRIPAQPVAKQRIIVLNRDPRARMAASQVVRSFGDATLRGIADVHEPATQPRARKIDYGGVDPFKAEVARALGRTEVLEGPPPDPWPAIAEPPANKGTDEPISPFAETAEFLPPPDLEHLRQLHEEAQRSQSEPEPVPEHLEAVEVVDEDPPRLPRAKLALSLLALLGVAVIGNWPLSNQVFQANLSGYSGAHELTSSVVGRVAKVLVSVGDHVATGQPVLELQPTPQLEAADPQAPSHLHAAHAGVVVHVHTVAGAALQPATPIASVLGDAAVPALIISCTGQEAELLLESGEVVVTLGKTKLTVLVTRLLDSAAMSDDEDDRRSVELALQDTAQLAELARHAEIGMPVRIELPERRTLFSLAGRFLRYEFQ